MSQETPPNDNVNPTGLTPVPLLTQEPSSLRGRAVGLALAICAVMTIGTVGFRILSPTTPNWIDCVFQTLVIVTTLGMDVVGIQNSSAPTGIRIFTMILSVLGIGIAATGFTTLTSFVVEGELSSLLGRRRMDRDIAKLRNHHIVCGAGRTGWNIIQDLIKARSPFVVIDKDGALLREIATRSQPLFRRQILFRRQLLYISGDATDEHTLQSAGLSRATGLFASLSNDRDNLFLVLSARHLNPEIRIIARGYEGSVQAKLKRAGADAVIYPNQIGGLRMSSELVRPIVVDFLEPILRDNRHGMRFEEIIIDDHNRFIGKTLREIHIRERTGLLIIACRPRGGEFVYNPPAETRIEAGLTLVALGAPEQIHHLRSLLDQPEEGAGRGRRTEDGERVSV